MNGLNVKFIKGNPTLLASLDIGCNFILQDGMPSSSPMYKSKPELVGKVIDEMIAILNKQHLQRQTVP